MGQSRKEEAAAIDARQKQQAMASLVGCMLAKLQGWYDTTYQVPSPFRTVVPTTLLNSNTANSTKKAA
jgi:hypothetical protein